VKPHFKIGTEVPESGIYWCTVCMTPDRFEKGRPFPDCRNLCGKCHWELVEKVEKVEK
jgi:hypothetical protein